MKEKVLVIAAHNDDPAVGAGGTLLKYKKEGKETACIIFSYGEWRQPHLKEGIMKDTRLKETKESNKAIGLKCLGYFDLDAKFKEQIEKKKIKKKLKYLMMQYGPNKIFTHSVDDPMPDHRAVYKLVMEILKEEKLDVDVYSFDIWNIVNFRNRNKPKLIVDISDQFKTKIEAIRKHESQAATVTSLVWKISWKNWLNGLGNNCRYAEVFVKIH